MLSSVRLDGTTACMAIDGATSAEVFLEYIRQVLVPSLRPGDVVIFDNLSAHKDAQATNLILTAGATVLPLPAYSPDLNPIEKLWSKVKAFLREAKARTFETLLNAIAAALQTVTPQDAEGWFQSCGYETSHS
jgi:transposase